jgi:predicted enzyme related to lactoylglutathione lyase
MSLRLCLDVPNVDRAVEFYCAAFGWTVGRRFDARWVELLGAPVPIDLLEKPAGSAPFPNATVQRTYNRHWTPVHFDVVVPDIDAAVTRAVAAGAELEAPIQAQPYGRLALLSDPFGHGFCLLEFHGRGYDELLARD